jgi:hypothetical protein
VQCRGKKIQKKKSLLLLHIHLIRLFDLSLECSKGPKRLLLRKGKKVTLFQLIQFYKMAEKYFVNFSEKIME